MFFSIIPPINYGLRIEVEHQNRTELQQAPTTQAFSLRHYGLMRIYLKRGLGFRVVVAPEWAGIAA